MISKRPNTETDRSSTARDIPTITYVSHWQNLRDPCTASYRSKFYDRLIDRSLPLYIQLGLQLILRYLQGAL
jgi:hypothetical protein